MVAKTVLGSVEIPLDIAILVLENRGYQSAPSVSTPGWIEVIDPVMVYGYGHDLEGDPTKTIFELRLMHPSQVYRFINERS
jgi:hypothetical protein